MADTTDNGEYDPMEWERRIIADTRAKLADASEARLRNALHAGLNQANALIQAHGRHPEWEWLFQRVRGATDIVQAVSRRLDA